MYLFAEFIYLENFAMNIYIYIDAYAWDCFLFSFKYCIQCKKKKNLADIIFIKSIMFTGKVVNLFYFPFTHGSLF